MLTKLMYIAVLAGTALVSLGFIPGVVGVVGKPLIVVAVATILAVLLVIGALKKGTLGIAKTWLIFSYLILAIASTISAIATKTQLSHVFDILALESTLYIASGLSLMIATISAFDSRKRIVNALTTVGGIGAVLVLFHVVRLLSGGTWFQFGVFGELTSTPVGSWNDLGIFFGLIAAVVLGILSLAKTPRVRLFLGILLGLALFGISVVNFFFAWVLLGVCALLMFVYAFSVLHHRDGSHEHTVAGDIAASEVVHEAGKKEDRRIPVLPIVVIIISFVFVLVSTNTNVYGALSGIPGLGFLNRFNVLNIEARPTLVTTATVGWQSLMKGNIFGVGPGNFSQAWNLYKPADVNRTPLWATDFSAGFSTAISSFVTLGVLGILAWIAITVSVVILVLKLLLRHYSSSADTQLGLAIGIGTLYLTVVMWLYTPGVVLFLVWTLALGLGIAHLRNTGAIKVRTYSYIDDPRIAFASVLGLVLVLLGCITVSYLAGSQMVAQIETVNAQVALSNNNIDLAGAALANAVRFDQREYPYRLLSDISLARLNQYVNEVGQTQGQQSQSQQQVVQQQLQGRIQETVAAASQAVAVNEKNYGAWLALGNVYQSLAALNVDKAYDEAVKAYSKAEELAPTNPTIKLAYAQLERSQKNYEKAFSYIDQAVQLKPDYTDAYFLRAQIHIEKGSIKDAIAAAEIGTLTAPRNPDVFLQLGILKYNDKDYEGASKSFEQALILNPDYANAKYFLALTYFELGNKTDARALGEDLSRTNPENEEVKQFLKSFSSEPVRTNTSTSTATSTSSR